MEIDFQTHVKQEAELFGSLKDNLWHEVTDRVQNHKTELAVEAVGAAIIGAGFGVMSKNPEILGQSLAPLIKAEIPVVGKVGLAGAALDWTFKIGAPAVDVWNNPDRLNQSKLDLAHNVGGGLVDYATLSAAGVAGGIAGFKYAPEFKLRAPEFDPRPSIKLNEVPRSVENPEAFTTSRSNDLPTDVRKLYEASFPKEERQPTEEVADFVARGRILVHTTRDAAGKLEAFSFTSLHDESPTKFAGLDFIATDAASRSNGIGSLHLQRVAGTIKAEGGYQLGKFDPAVLEFNKNNGYWQPPSHLNLKLNSIGTAVFAGTYPSGFGLESSEANKTLK